MPGLESKGSTSMEQDPDAKWARWLVESRRNGPTSPFGASTDSHRSSLGGSPGLDSHGLCTSSSATRYFALLSAHEDGYGDGRSFASHKSPAKACSPTTRDMDASWVAWFTKEWQERQPVFAPGERLEGDAHDPTEPPTDTATAAPAFMEDHQPLITITACLQRPENATVSNTINDTAAGASSSVGTADPTPPSMNNLFDCGPIDTMSSFAEILSQSGSTMPFELASTQTHGAAGPPVTVGLGEGDYIWFNAQNPFSSDVIAGTGMPSSSGKRSREVYSDEYAHDGQIHPRNVPIKKPRNIYL